jgi:hypothetical protein
MRPRDERVGGHFKLGANLAVRALGERGCGNQKWDEKCDDEEATKTAMEGKHKTP